MRRRMLIVLPALLALALLVGACGDDDENESGLPNPASVYCTEQGGDLEIRTDADGNQYGVCIFSDGSECDEWAFFRGECRPGDSLAGETGIANPASVYCEEQGGTLDLESGMCRFSDGSECEEWAFFRGECQPGDSLGDEAGIANPASVYCEEQGGTLDLESGMCRFSDGSECEEWAFFRGECQPGQSAEGAMGGIGLANPASEYCLAQGGASEMRTAADGSQYGVCVFADGTEYDEWALYRGEVSTDG